MRDVAHFLPNITPNSEVFLFYDYECIEHFPFHNSELLGKDFAYVCCLLDVSLPFDCNYAYFRRHGYTTTVKEFGSYQYIINTKIQLKQNEQNPSS